MAYTDPQYQIFQRQALGNVNSGLALSTATATASATQTITGAFKFPTFLRPLNFNNIRTYVVMAPAAGITNLTFNFLNGTSTIATANVSTLTAGQFVDATITGVTIDSHGNPTGPDLITTIGFSPTVNCTYTATASGSSLGSYAFDIEYSDLFVT
jgi:hypothetical protein